MSKNDVKPATNSSDSETEWTFIDTYDGTIETRKNCVTYRKPTFAEAVRGVSEEELAEVESEPEFEVLASFQFRSKGETFGIGSSAPKTTEKTAKTQKSEGLGQFGSCPFDDILVISGSEKSNSCTDLNDDVQHENTCSEDAIVVVDEGFSCDDTLDEDLIDFGDDTDDENADDGDVRASFINTSLNNISIFDDDKDGDGFQSSFINTSLNNISIFDDEEEDKEEDVHTTPENKSPVNKWLLCIDTLESSKDLAWDNLTFNLMNTMPLMMASTSAVDGLLNDNSQDQNQSDSGTSFEPISHSDSETFSSYNDSSDDADDALLIPAWFFNPDLPLGPRTSNKELPYMATKTTECESSIPDWFFDESCKELALQETNNELIIPSWLHKTTPDFKWDDINCKPLIPEWFYNPDHNTSDKNYTHSYDSDSDSQYTDDSDYDNGDGDDSVIAIPDWLFSERKASKDDEEEDYDSLLFSQLFVDVPTFIILLFLTTALGFSIGHGLTVYFGTHSLNRNSKMAQANTQHSSMYSNDFDQRMLSAEEIAKVDLLKLEEEIYKQKENELLSSHLRYDLSNIHKSLQQKHYRLLKNYKSAEDRLHVSKSMSWFWRLKYDQEKRRKQNSSAVVYLQNQLQRIGALYEKEKTVANKWRRYKQSRFPVHKLNYSGENNSSADKMYNAKASLASKYWVKAILSSRSIDWDGFKKRWTKDLEKLKRESCTPNVSFPLKYKRCVSRPKNNKKSIKRNHLPKKTLKDENDTEKFPKISDGDLRKALHKKVFRSFPLAPTGPPVHPPNKKRRQLMFGPINISLKCKKGETARRRREQRLLKKEGQRKDTKIQLDELKSVIVELRRERRKAKKEKFLLEASWRNLKKEQRFLQQEAEKRQQSEQQKFQNIMTKLKRERKKLEAWKDLASQFKTKAKFLERDMKKMYAANNSEKDILNIKKDLRLEKRKIKKQRTELKSLKNKLRQEHRNYAREGWKLAQKQKKLERANKQNDKSLNSKKRKKKLRRQNKGNVFTKGKLRRSKRKDKKTKKSQWKQKEAFVKYWEKLEKTLKDWTQSLNKTVREKSGGKIKKVWNRLQEKVGNLINFDWIKSKPTKPPYKAKKSKSKKKSNAALIYEKVLAEQREFDRRKRQEAANDQKNIHSRSPTVMAATRQSLADSKTVDKRRRKRRRKYQLELERLQQWALQMNEKKLEHDQLYKDKDKKISECSKERFKSKGTTTSIKDLEEESLDDSSNLTNTLMLIVPPTFNDREYKEFTKFESGGNSESLRSLISDMSFARKKQRAKAKKTTDLSIPFDEHLVPPKSSGQSSNRKDEDKEKDLKNSIKPTPPVLDSSMYNKLSQLGIIGSHKGGSFGLVIPPPELSPLKTQDATDGLQSSTWYNDKTSKVWIPPPTPQDDPLFYQTSSVPRSVDSSKEVKAQKDKRPEDGNKESNSKDNWMLLRASGRAHQRILYEPLNKQTAKDKSKRQSYFNRKNKPNAKDSSWLFHRANDRKEQRSKNTPWYEKRADGREEERRQSKDSWFIERGLEREFQRNEEPQSKNNDYDDDDDYYDDDDDEFGYEFYDDFY